MNKNEFKLLKQTYKKELLELRQSSKDIVEEVTAKSMGEDSRAHVKIDLRGEEIYEPYSGKGKINRDLFDHVKDEISYIKASVPVTLDFIIDPSEEQEVEKIKGLFTQMANFEFRDSSTSLKRNRIAVASCMVTGIILLVAYELFMFFSSGNFFGEIISIASWVFIWEAVDRYVFTRMGIQKDGLIQARLASAKIVFHVREK